MLQLVQALLTDHDFQKVQHLYYRSCGVMWRQLANTVPKFEVCKSSATAIYPDLDDLPMPMRNFKLEPERLVFEVRRDANPKRIEYLSSSRGCPKRCSFCSIIAMSPKYRARSVDSIMNEISTLYRKNPFGHIQFLDANFFVHAKRALEFSIQLKSWNPEITWSGTATADFIRKNSEIIRVIGSLNCLSLEIGIENGSNDNLSRYNKKTTVSDNFFALEILEISGIELDLDFVLYDPDTTIDGLRTNLRFLREAELLDYFPADHFYNGLKLYPGTAARDYYSSRFGLTDDDLDKELVAPFEDKRVDIVFSLMSAFEARAQSRLNIAIRELDFLCRNSLRRTDTDLGFTVQHALIVMVKMRFIPSRLLDSLLACRYCSLPEHDKFAFAEMQDIVDRAREASNCLLSDSEILCTALRQEKKCDSLELRRGAHLEWKNKDLAPAEGLAAESFDNITYLIPLWSLPIRLNSTGSVAWAVVASNPTIASAEVHYSSTTQCEISDAKDELKSFIDQLIKQEIIRYV